MEKIKTDPNLAFKIKGLIYGQKYLTNKDINALNGWNEKNLEYQTRLNQIIAEMMKLRMEQWKSGKWRPKIEFN